MHNFLRNLSISNENSLQDVVEPCSKILSWLTTHAQSALNYEEIETILKSAIYMEECIVLFGGLQLIKALIVHEPGLKEFYKAQADIMQEKAFIAHAISLILKTCEGNQHMPVVEEILRHIYDKEQTEQLILEAAKKEQTHTPSTVQQQRLLLVVQQLFQLPQAQIALAIERVISNLHFEVLGYVFLEPAQSAYFARCSILCQRICEHCTAGSIPAHFIDSLHQTAAYSDEGRYFFWQCLNNICFARSLRNFCIKYFESLKEPDEIPANFEHFNMQNICYLFCMALNVQSPCRLAYQRALNKANIIPYYINLMQRNIRIFNDN